MIGNNRLKFILGFHLIEILITLAIVSILAALSFPLYSQYLVEERRLSAETMLIKLAAAMEQYQLENNTYQAASLDKLHFPSLIAKDNYQLIIQTATNNDYLLLAKPLHQQALKDDKCLTLTLNANNQKGITGPGTVEECW